MILQRTHASALRTQRDGSRLSILSLQQNARKRAHLAASSSSSACSYVRHGSEREVARGVGLLGEQRWGSSCRRRRRHDGWWTANAAAGASDAGAGVDSTTPVRRRSETVSKSPFGSMLARKKETEYERELSNHTLQSSYKAVEEAWLRGIVERILAIPVGEDMAVAKDRIKSMSSMQPALTTGLQQQQKQKQLQGNSSGSSSSGGGGDSTVSKILSDFLRTKPSGLTSKACTQLVKSVSAGGRPELALQVFADLHEYGHKNSQHDGRPWHRISLAPRVHRILPLARGAPLTRSTRWPSSPSMMNACDFLTPHHSRCPSASRNKFTFSAAIAAASSLDQMNDVKRLFAQMLRCDIEPDRIVYNTMMTACTRSGLYEEASHFFDEMVSRGIEPDTYSYNSRVTAYMRAGELTKALELGNGIKKKDAVSYCNLITILGRLGRTNDIMSAFESATGKRRTNDSVFSNLRVYNATIYALAIASNQGCDQAVLLIERMQEVDRLKPRTDTYNSLIAGYARHRRAKDASDCLDWMRRRNLRPDKRTYTCVINACARSGEWDMAVDTFRKMRKSGVAADQYTYSTLITALSTGKLLDLAESVLQEMHDEGVAPNDGVYNSLIVACESCGEAVKAVSYFDTMRRQGMLPDFSTCERLLSLCEREELWSDARRVLEAMQQHQEDVDGLEIFMSGMRITVPQALSRLPNPLKDAASAVVESGRIARDVLEDASMYQGNIIADSARLAFNQGRRVRGLISKSSAPGGGDEGGGNATSVSAGYGRIIGGDGGWDVLNAPPESPSNSESGSDLDGPSPSVTEGVKGDQGILEP